MNRKDKTALLSSLMQGNTAPLVRHCQQNEAKQIHAIQARPLHSYDRVTDITHNGQSIPDMSHQDFEQWQMSIGAKGGLVISFIRPERRVTEK